MPDFGVGQTGSEYKTVPGVTCGRSSTVPTDTVHDVLSTLTVPVVILSVTSSVRPKVTTPTDLQGRSVHRAVNPDLVSRFVLDLSRGTSKVGTGNLWLQRTFRPGTFSIFRVILRRRTGPRVSPGRTEVVWEWYGPNRPGFDLSVFEGGWSKG